MVVVGMIRARRASNRWFAAVAQEVAGARASETDAVSTRGRTPSWAAFAFALASALPLAFASIDATIVRQLGTWLLGYEARESKVDLAGTARFNL